MSAVPITPRSSGAFSHTLHPWGRTLVFQSITPQYLHDHLAFSSCGVFASFMTNILANTVLFLPIALLAKILDVLFRESNIGQISDKNFGHFAKT